MIEEIRRKLTYLRDTVDFGPLDNQSGDRLEFSREKGTSHLWRDHDHRFQLGPTLTEQQIREVEQKYGVELPEGYRAFLLEVGNGGVGDRRGAGPGFDFYSLSKSLDSIRGDITKPFPYTHRWNEPGLDDFETGEAYWEEVDSERHVQGTMLIAYFGCTQYGFIVVTGGERGKVWLSDRGACIGVWPVIVRDNKIDSFYLDDDRSSPHVDFLTWYVSWLDERIEFYDRIYKGGEESPDIMSWVDR